MRTLACLFLAAVLGCCGTQGQVTVISEPDDVTICEGEEAVFTCVLNSNIRSDDVQWYRFIKDTSTTVMVDPNGGNFNIMNHSNESTTSSSLTITNAIKSYTGYFWVGTSSLNVCNASLTVLTKPSALKVNIMKNIENLSIVVQWDAVDDSLLTTYTVQWIDDRNLHEVATLDEQTSYTITGLTLDTVYIIHISTINMCGDGPEFSTSVSFSTDATSTTSTISPTVTASTTPMTTTANPSSTTTTTVIICTSTRIIIPTATTTITTTTVFVTPSTIIFSTLTTTIDASTKTTNLMTAKTSIDLLTAITTTTTGVITVDASIATTTVVKTSIVTTTITTTMESLSTTDTASTVSSTSALSTSIIGSATSPTGNPADTTTADESSNGMSELSTGAVAIITFAVTFIVSVTVTAIITFIVAYICVKRTLEKAYSAHNVNKQSPKDQAVYEQVKLPSHTVTKNDLELQPNPAYGTSHEVIVDTNPAYESCK